MLKLSVIIPAYNTAQYLPECLDSVLSQDIDGLEVICVNDGSPDNALQIMKEYAAKDARIVVIDKPNEGVGAARNDGIRAARGEFVAFMDSDDFYPNAQVLKKLYELAIQNQVDICGGRYRSVRQDGGSEESRFVYHNINVNPTGVTLYRDFQFDYGYCAYIFKTSLLQEQSIFFPTYSRFQDPPFFVKAMIAAGKFYAVDEPTYCYRYLPGSGKTTIRKTMDMLSGLSDNLRISREQGLARLHYISACRLNEEGSYMAIQNLNDERRYELLARIIQACALVDATWLKEQGYVLPEPFVLDVFKYVVDTANKYEKLRKNKVLRMLARLAGRKA